MKSLRSLEDRKSRRVIDLLIEKPLYGGLFLARDRGRIYMVRYTIPGELVLVQPVKVKKDHTEAVPVEIKVPSEWRQEAPCPYYGKCGGCQYQHLKYEFQLKMKKMILEESLSRIGKIKRFPEPEIIPSGDEWGYRIRVQFKGRRGKVGFFRWGEHEMVDVDYCLVVHPKINDLIPALRKISLQLEAQCEFHVTYSPTEDRFLLLLVTPTEIDRELLRSFKNSLPEEVVGLGNFLRVGQSLTARNWIGREHIYIDAGGFRFRISGGSFFQVNWTLWENLMDAVTEGADFRKAVELYCGVGFFTMKLASRGNFVEASDGNPYAINDAKYSAKVNGIENALFIKSSAFRHLKMRGGDVIDLLVLDPPRSGLSSQERDLLIKNKPQRIVYVSCNPATLSRDLADLIKGGYEIKRLKLIDNFPQTYHVETIAFLEVQE